MALVPPLLQVCYFLSMSFVHLHNHTHYSLLDGLSKPQQLIQAAIDHDMPAMAITDHGVLYGAVEFYKEAKSNGIKPIIGCEMYITPDRFQKDSTVKRANHLLLHARNEEGYKNLMCLVSQAHLEGFYYKPRIDHKLLRAHSAGLLATSGCLAGEIPKALLGGDKDRAYELVKEYQDIFGKDFFYLEVQNHPNIDDQISLNHKIREMGADLGIPIVATNDCHYTNADEAHAHDILVCIQTGKTLLDDDRMKYDSDFHVASPEEMKACFSDIPEAITNTLEVADKCDLELKFGQNLLPKYATPQRKKAGTYLRELCEEGLDKLYEGKLRTEAQDRLDYEIGVINKMGFADYFLIVWDIILHAKEKGIVVGPGRGSAAGSIIAYSLDITTIDPLKYGLIFERFLNPDRVSMPDIDIDFADHRREEVFDYVVEKYGRECVAHVITFGRMTAKAAVRDVGRAMGYPYSEVDTISKLLPPMILGKHNPIKDSVENDPELNAEYKKNPRAKTLLDNAMKLEGTIRHAGTHACAVAVSREPLVNYTPLQNASGKDEAIITQYSMGPLEEIGLLKIDFLGLRNLTIIEHTLNIVRETRGDDIELASIPLDDKEAFELLARGETTGVFQLESSGMKRYLKDLKPTQLEDIIAMNALYRPGPMEYIPAYIRGKHNPKKIKYMHELFEPILSETYGVGVYQEQILEIARVFAGFTLGQADLLRKAVGKKDPALLEKQREKFINGAVAEGHDAEFAEKVFDDLIEPFAGYGFNKAHATCYAMIAYHTAYLKAHYPTEFMAALLTADKENTDRVVIEINECAQMGIEVLPPSVNESSKDFTVVEENKIRFGLVAVKGVGENTVLKMIEARTEGKFETLADFAERVPPDVLNKKNIQALAYSGAMDDFGDRLQIAEGYEAVSKYGKTHGGEANSDQMNIFGMMDEDQEAAKVEIELPQIEPMGHIESLKMEKQFLGLYVSGHPLQGLAKYMSKKVQLIASLATKDVGKKVTVGGLILTRRKILTKKGDYMMFVTIEDPTGEIEVCVFPNTYNKEADKFTDDKFMIVEGRLDKRRDFQVICEGVRAVSIESMIENAKESGVFGQTVNIEPPPAEGEPEVATADESPAQKSDEKPTFVISIPQDAKPNALADLKLILSENLGRTKVELHFMNGSDILKKVKLSQGINLEPEIETKILNLFKNVQNT